MEIHVVHGYTLKQVVDHLQINYSTAGRLVRIGMEKARGT